MMRVSRTNLISARPCSGGFTLIEVLIATVIIALGTLGLLALFAGAASQQQSSSRSTSASFMVSNAESTLRENFGALNVITGSLARDVWYPMTMDPTYGYLNVSPVPGVQMYALIPATNQTLFNAGALPNPDSPGVQGPTTFDGGQTPPAMSALTSFPHRDIVAGSLRVQVEISYLSEQPPLGSGNFVRQTIQRSFLRDPSEVYPSDQPASGVYIFTEGGTVDNDPMYVDRFTGPIDPAQTRWIKVYLAPRTSSQGGNQGVARVWGMNLPQLTAVDDSYTSPRIESVIATQYQWRNDKLASLRERIVQRADDRAPGGVVPELAYSVAFRQTAGGFQAAVFSYQLAATSSASKYMPPERPGDINSNAGPLRRAVLQLGYDPLVKQYFFESNSATYAWALTSGQTLLVEGDPVTTGDAGADDVVRVQRTTLTGTVRRAYLDRGPRSGNRSMLPTAARTGNGRQQLRVLGVADSVRSAEDGSVWTLRALDARVLQVPFGG